MFVADVALLVIDAKANALPQNRMAQYGFQGGGDFRVASG